MLRAILALLFAILYLIIGIPVLFVEWIIGKFNRQAADISQLRMVQWAFRVILFICGTRLTIIGEENVPKDQPVLYIGNHRSYFDIIITYSRCPRLTGYVAKDSMKKVPLLSVWMSRLHLSVHQSFGCQRSVKNDPCRNRQYQKRDFDVYFP